MPLANLTWGGYTLPQADTDGGIETEGTRLGSARRTLAGSLRVDILADKRRIRLAWKGLTETEYGTLTTAYAALKGTPSTLQISDGRTWTVLPSAPPREAVEWEGGKVPRYSVSMEFEEA